MPLTARPWISAVGKYGWPICRVMPKPSSVVAAEVARRARDIDRYLRRLDRLTAQRAFAERDAERAYTGGFLEFHAYFEQALQRLFLGLLVERFQSSDKRVRPRIRVSSDRVAMDIVAGGTRPYVDWLPYDSYTLPRAKAFFAGGRPFDRLGTGYLNDLKQGTVIRNALAHRSSSAKRRFEKIPTQHEEFAAESMPTVGLSAWHPRPRTESNELPSVFLGEGDGGIGEVVVGLSFRTRWEPREVLATPAPAPTVWWRRRRATGAVPAHAVTTAARKRGGARQRPRRPGTRRRRRPRQLVVSAAGRRRPLALHEHGRAGAAHLAWLQKYNTHGIKVGSENPAIQGRAATKIGPTSTHGAGSAITGADAGRARRANSSSPEDLGLAEALVECRFGDQVALDAALAAGASPTRAAQGTAPAVRDREPGRRFP